MSDDKIIFFMDLFSYGVLFSLTKKLSYCARFHTDDLVAFHLYFLYIVVCTIQFDMVAGDGGNGDSRDTWQLFNVSRGKCNVSKT